MVHHKIHDKEWTALGIRPDQDPQPRFLWPPSTAATLNLAATAAQCARIWPKLDKKFADRCLTAAEKAWAAAVANPAVSRGTSAVGGGPYDDKDVSDEFYWAAAELYATTKKDVVQDVPREVAPLQEGAGGRRRRRDPDVDDVGHGPGARDDHAGDGAERAAAEGHRRLQGGDQGGGRQLRRARRPAGLPRAVQARQEGLPVGLELVRAQQRDHHRAGGRHARATRST